MSLWGQVVGCGKRKEIQKNWSSDNFLVCLVADSLIRAEMEIIVQHKYVPDLSRQTFNTVQNTEGLNTCSNVGTITCLHSHTV